MVDKASRIPVYVQLMEIIKEQIVNENLSDHEKIPSERELCDVYHVSRATVRQAIQVLETEGYIYTKKGIGSFVAERTMNQELSGFYSYTESMKQLGKVISTDLISFDKIACDKRLAHKMQVEVGKEIYRFTRLRFADQEPMLIVTTHLPCERYLGLEADHLAKGSLYTLLKEDYHTHFDHVYESLQSVTANRVEADLLQIEQDAACMKIDRYSYEGDCIVEYAVGIARGDKFKYKVRLL